MKTIRHFAVLALAAVIGITLPLEAAAKGKKSVTSEPLGKFALGQASAEVVKVLGKPASKGKDLLQEATGTRVQEWSYPAQGLTFTMESLQKNGAQTVHMIRVAAPCTLATARGIQIGSPEAAVQKAYAKERDKAQSKAGKSFLAGSPYDGVDFTFKAGKVSEIVIGAAAE